MAINQKIRETLKRGDIAEIARILNVTHQSINKRLSTDDKEIDSIPFLIAVCKVTGKPASYFLPEADFLDQLIDQDLKKEIDILNMENEALKNKIIELQDEVSQLKDKIIKALEIGKK